jgi:Transposase zinc-binding domain
MNRPTLEVADIIRATGNSFIERHRAHLAWPQLKVLRAIRDCRTAALGGHLDQCSRCGRQAISYNSCRNRHCPKCQTNKRDQWLAKQTQDLLPVPYFHVVFTLPHELSALVLQNMKLLYDVLLRTSADTVLEVAAEPSLMMPGIINSFIFSEQSRLFAGTVPLQNQFAGSMEMRDDAAYRLCIQVDTLNVPRSTGSRLFTFQ